MGFSLLFIFVSGEAACSVYYSLREHGNFSVPELMNRDGNIYINDRGRFLKDRLKRNLSNGVNFPSPYFSYTAHRLPPFGTGAQVNRAGFYGPEFPLEKEDGVFTIMISGGSVAAGFFNSEAAEELEKTLNRDYTNEHIQKFILVGGAIGGWREPQQAALFMHYVQGLDGFINLMGCNENLALNDGDLQNRLEHPGGRFYVAAAAHFGSRAGLFAYRLDEAIKQWQHESWIAQHSRFIYFVTQALRGLFRQWAVNQKFLKHPEAQGNSSRQFKFPSEWPVEKRSAYILESIKKYIRIEHEIARPRDVKTLFLIQPYSLINKPLSDEEKKTWEHERARRESYLEMSQELMDLQSEGIPIYSLLDIFEGKTQTLYRDGFHLYPEGNEILARNILQIIEREWGFTKKPRPLS